ncbi:vitamin K epoxide reductase family protein [Candidatus Saccharibacteria bacterium]|nr:vitamin K epoxide reductase family protein [Candidatus Saccharibacteria bacterium]
MVAATVGLAASFVLTYDKIHYLKDPSYVPSCNINPIISCGTVMKTEQADLLGLPNTVFGIAGFSVLLFVGLLLATGSKVHKKIWQLLNTGVLAGFIFSLYLFFEGVYRINAICPYCFVVWVIMPPVLLYTTLYNLQAGNIKLGLGEKIKHFLLRFHWEVLTTWYVIFFGILLTHFWYYWQTLF